MNIPDIPGSLLISNEDLSILASVCYGGSLCMIWEPRGKPGCPGARRGLAFSAGWLVSRSGGSVGSRVKQIVSETLLALTPSRNVLETWISIQIVLHSLLTLVFFRRVRIH